MSSAEVVIGTLRVKASYGTYFWCPNIYHFQVFVHANGYQKES